MKNFVSVLVAASFLLAGCLSNPNQPAATATPTVQAQATYTPLPTYTPYPTGAPPNTATPTLAPTATPAPTTEAGPCQDGQLVLDELANQGSLLNRLMVGEAERVTVVHVSWPGEGFASLDRVIVIAPRQGHVWQVFVKSGAYSISTRGFCGSNQEVADWADPAEVESLRRASADTNGEMPPVSEIGIYLLNYEERTLSVVKNAPDGPTPEEVLEHLELTFSENGNNANVPLTVAKPTP